MNILLTAALFAALTTAQVEELIPKLATALEDNYVFPETGKRYAAMLRANAAAGRYARFTDSGDFAIAVTADLQAVAPDGHLVLIAPRPAPQATPSAPAPASDEPPPIGKSGWIAPGVAYIEFHSFPSDKETVAKVRDFLQSHAHAKTLIIDTVHEHSGGWIGEADLLFSDLFAAPRDLVTIDVRKSVVDRLGGLRTGPSIRTVDAPEGIVRYVHSVNPAPNPALKNAKVYMLISHHTISAGEHLAFVLKQTHRATLIGETTYGAGNVETHFEMPAGFSVVIPFGRAYDPKTGAGWEQVGVKPDIKVPADQALDKALQLAGVRKH